MSAPPENNTLWVKQLAATTQDWGWGGGVSGETDLDLVR